MVNAALRECSLVNSMAVHRRARRLHIVILVTAASLLAMFYVLTLPASEHRHLYPLASSFKNYVTANSVSLSRGTKPSEKTHLGSKDINIQLTSMKPSGTLVTRNATDIARKKKHFVVTITHEEREKFRFLMKTFANVVPDNVTYFMYSGTLIGSYRHHGLIPWDDDLDLFVRDADKDTLSKVLSVCAPGLLTKRVSHSMKFYHMSSARTKFGWNWPFLDIFFFLENKTHLWDSHPTWIGHKYLKEDIFPLTKRPFMGMLLPAPKNTAKVLEKLYDVESCETKFYDHKNEKFMKKDTLISVPCVELEDTFAFVKRRNESNSILETITDESGVSSSFSIIN